MDFFNITVFKIKIQDLTEKKKISTARVQIYFNLSKFGMSFKLSEQPSFPPNLGSSWMCSFK